jgi:hypothetical protein
MKNKEIKMEKSAKEKCGGCGNTEAVTKKRIAKKAAVLCASLPDELTCKALTNRNAADFLSAMRAFMAECTLANSWDREDFASYSKGLELVEVSFELGSSMKPVTTTPQSTCGDAKRDCVNGCDNEDAGYFCYFDCRLEYVTCLIGSVIVSVRNQISVNRGTVNVKE